MALDGGWQSENGTKAEGATMDFPASSWWYMLWLMSWQRIEALGLVKLLNGSLCSSCSTRSEPARRTEPTSQISENRVLYKEMFVDPEDMCIVWALAKMSFDDKDLNGYLTRLGVFELEALQDWEHKFMGKKK